MDEAKKGYRDAEALLEGAFMGTTAPKRRRGRPALATPAEVVEQIRAAQADGGLFRVHISRPALYARARRIWGTWAAALAAAGIDHEDTMSDARKRSMDSRRQRRARIDGVEG